MALDLELTTVGRAVHSPLGLFSPHPADSIVDKTILPDSVTPIIQWIFQRSPWVMWGGVALAASVSFILLRWLWPRRRVIRDWLVNRGSLVKLALVGGAAVAVLGAAGLGMEGYHFVDTDRRFCNGCHIFVPSGQAVVQPDTGYYSLVPRLEGKHDTLSCHACHELKPLKEGVKLVLWMSGIRDKQIPAHGRVPRAVCERCHVQGAARETWQAIAATAGHRTHLESDSSALKGKVECLTCHARTAHRFLPADSTCVQHGCHLTDETRIKLGKMGDQTDLHCIVCHQFTKPVPALATRDSAAGALRPDFRQCFSCHDMKQQLAGFEVGHDPHNGVCGMCHNPHSQTKPADAVKSCTDAQCHATWRNIPFHTGAAHRRVAQQCILCHSPHAARVDASDCESCHERARGSVTGRSLRPPPVPFDTTKALKRSSALPQPREPRGKGDAPPADPAPAARFVGAAASDSFAHLQHRKLACLTCHSTRSKTSSLTFESPRGCQICHHQAPAQSRCGDCHQEAELAASRQLPVTVSVPRQQPRTRDLSFSHATHSATPCTGCHTSAVSLQPDSGVIACRSCHDQHHSDGRNCAGCHRSGDILQSHAGASNVHRDCEGCHTANTVAALTPTRGFCLACHGKEQDHYGPRECTVCHFQASPAEFQAHIAGTAGGG